MSDVVLRVRGLAKTYSKPFSSKKVQAVRGLDLDVERGEIFGFLGPNGAGKTTTLKMLVGLVRPTAGEATLLGQAVPSPEAMQRVGYLPENPYVYPYLTPREFVSLCGRLNGLSGKKLRERTDAVLERVGIGYAADRAVRALSKGMLQRAGLAAALVHDPELLVLDEPMSGLDPVGRKEVRDLIVDEAAHGRTVFFSSHILSDVETLCDRVTILRKGEVVVAGKIHDLLGKDTRGFELTVLGAGEAAERALGALATSSRRAGDALVLEVEGDAALERALASVYAEGARIESVVPKRETLEALFVRQAL